MSKYQEKRKIANDRKFILPRVVHDAIELTGGFQVHTAHLLARREDEVAVRDAQATALTVATDALVAVGAVAGEPARGGDGAKVVAVVLARLTLQRVATREPVRLQLVAVAARTLHAAWGGPVHGNHVSSNRRTIGKEKHNQRYAGGVIRHYTIKGRKK